MSSQILPLKREMVDLYIKVIFVSQHTRSFNVLMSFDLHLFMMQINVFRIINKHLSQITLHSSQFWWSSLYLGGIQIYFLFSSFEISWVISSHPCLIVQPSLIDRVNESFSNYFSFRYFCYQLYLYSQSILQTIELSIHFDFDIHKIMFLRPLSLE